VYHNASTRDEPRPAVDDLLSSLDPLLAREPDLTDTSRAPEGK
jgi:hypothetical protein